MKRYKFLRLINNDIRSDNGDTIWELGKWQKHKGKLDMCHQGFHCSKEIYQAFSYVQGEILAEVEVKGKHKSEDDKEVWSDMRLVKLWKWQKKDSVALSIFSAELCLKNFEKTYPEDKRPREAIEAAKRWLKNPTKENESAARSAWSAARSAARSAWSAAWSVAWSAESAAESAARSAESAARSVAWSAWSAARSAELAAWSAAESAAESAAWSAESAARSVARSVESAARASDLIKKISKWMADRELEEYL